MALIAAAVLVIAAATVGVVLLTSGDAHPYTPQTFTHAHGTTEIKSAPHAVAALGPGDADAVLSLGLQPGRRCERTSSDCVGKGK